jgi:hypothetical protein
MSGKLERILREAGTSYGGIEVPVEAFPTPGPCLGGAKGYLPASAPPGARGYDSCANCQWPDGSPLRCDVCVPSFCVRDLSVLRSYKARSTNAVAFAPKSAAKTAVTSILHRFQPAAGYGSATRRPACLQDQFLKFAHCFDPSTTPRAERLRGQTVRTCTV